MAKILLYDVETFPTLAYVWEMYETNVIEVAHEGYMLSFAYKWLGEKKVHTVALPDFKGYARDRTNDKKLVEQLAKLFAQADIIVGHNVDAFDNRYTNARLLKWGIDPPPPHKTVDTLKIARRKFKFLSNKLDDLGQVLEVGRKLAHTGKHLWLACGRGDPRAWRKMKAYNAQDVRLLEAVYLKLRPWAPSHPNVNIVDRKLGACPKCASTHLQKRGHHYNATSEREQYKCMGCGAWCYGPWERLAQKIRIK